MPRSQALQIYMKPGLKEDDLMLRVWEACKKSGRPQHVFRTMLRAGLISMVESGDMPESVIEECGLDSLVERRRKRVSRHSPASQQQTPAADPYAPYPPQPRYAPYPAYQAPYQEQPVYAPPPVQAQPRYYEEEHRPAPPVEMPPPRHEEPPVAARPAAPEPMETRPVQPVQANPSTSEDGAKPQRKLGKLM